MLVDALLDRKDVHQLREVRSQDPAQRRTGGHCLRALNTDLHYTKDNHADQTESEVVHAEKDKKKQLKIKI